MSTLPQDWRLWITAEATIPTPLGPFVLHDKGRIVTVTRTRHPVHGASVFPTPSPSMLPLGVAIDATVRVRELKSLLAPPPDRPGKDWEVSFELLPTLYDFFGACMIVTTFSFHSLEAFANDLLDRNERRTFTVTYRDKQVQMTSEQVEKQFPAEAKLDSVLKEALGLPSLRSDQPKLWQRFQEMKSVRDGIAHTKSCGHYLHHKQESSKRLPIDRESIYFKFLNKDIEGFPRLVLQIMRVFAHPASDVVFKEAEARLAG